ncbi:chemotaxis protein CheW [Cystobacter ferrugineus]|uniref:Defective in fruiting DifE n=1 Tax=Cystobacter ferrugineus TaxID=83449 RepID=A0A1L9B4B0_9BACT|nr:defective in fruiting DifE [Cystobacter ferrugineus]OJH37066.1 defective in fruiting DifE [Cystobacter ferrugineus]
MPLFESGRRLCLLLEAGGTRFSVEATSVTEVAAPDPDQTSLRGVLEVQDLSVLLGGEPEPTPGMVVVLDVSPTLAVRVSSVVEVADVTRAVHFVLPSVLGDSLAALSHSAVMHKGRLYLELGADVLPHEPGIVTPPPLPTLYLFGFPPERSLVFESQGRLFGLPLPFISQVVMRGESFSALPGRGGAIAGLMPHGQVLWPLYSVPALLGGRAVAEDFLVLAEVEGRTLGLCASRVIGVYPRFEPTGNPGEFTVSGVPDPILFVDLWSMFS